MVFQWKFSRPPVPHEPQRLPRSWTSTAVGFTSRRSCQARTHRRSQALAFRVYQRMK